MGDETVPANDGICDNCRQPDRPAVRRCLDVWGEPHTHPATLNGPSISCALVLCDRCVRAVAQARRAHKDALVELLLVVIDEAASADVFRAPRLLDLFCCAGGAAAGYHRAGFEVVGVDVAPQPNYPFEFHKADALTFPLDGFDAVHASPPCQRYSDLAKRNGNADAWPDLVGPVRDRLIASGLPYVIENVEGAPLIDPVMLCGTMFPGLRVLRHRLFESNLPLTAPPHGRHPLVFTHDKRKAHYGRLDQDVSFVQVTGGGNCTVANKADAMGIDWMRGGELNEAIPPAYTEFIGSQLLTHLAGAGATSAEDVRNG